MDLLRLSRIVILAVSFIRRRSSFGVKLSAGGSDDRQMETIVRYSLTPYLTPEAYRHVSRPGLLSLLVQDL